MLCCILTSKLVGGWEITSGLLMNGPLHVQRTHMHIELWSEEAERKPGGSWSPVLASAGWTDGRFRPQRQLERCHASIMYDMPGVCSRPSACTHDTTKEGGESGRDMEWRADRGRSSQAQLPDGSQPHVCSSGLLPYGEI